MTSEDTPSERTERYQRLNLRWMKIGTVVSAVSAIIAVAALVYVGQQLRLASESLDSTAFQTITTQSLELDKLFVDQYDLRPFFEENEDIDSSQPSYDRAVAVADSQLDLFDSFLTQSGHMSQFKNKGDDNETWRAWMAYMEDSFGESPLMCSRLNDVQRWYTKEFVALADGFCPPDTIIPEDQPE